MKKLACFVLFLFLVQASANEVTIPEDFYINDGDLIKKGAIIAENILPSALRVCITEGESYELYADVLPENTTEQEGYSSVSITPQTERCTVFGKSAGNARIRVTAPGGAAAEIDVEIKEAKKTNTANEGIFIPEKRKESESNGKTIKIIVWVLSLPAAGMFLLAAYLWVRGKKREEK